MSSAVGAPFLRYRYIAGMTDANGSLRWTWTAPNLPASDAIILRWQHAEIQTSGVVPLGRMHVMTVLDPAF